MVANRHRPCRRLRTPAARPTVRVRVFAVATILAIAGLVGIPAGAAGAASGTPLRPPAHGLLFGASVRAENGQTSGQNLAALEHRVGRTMAMSRVYDDWDEKQPSSSVTDDLAHGRVPLLSIAPQLKNGQKLSWSSIASGAHDADIRRQADALKATGKPILLAFHHEADLATGFGTPAQFRAAFRHYATVVRGTGETNISLVLIMTPRGYNDTDDWYPGSSYVDWLGVDAYNFASCRPGLPPWHSLQYEAQPFYNWASGQGKPLVLAEWGAPYDSSQPQRRADWIRAAQSTLAKWTQIKASIYFDIAGTCAWQLGTSGSSLKAFTAFGHAALANP